MVSIKVEDLVIEYKPLSGITIQKNFFQKHEKRYMYRADRKSVV